MLAKHQVPSMASMASLVSMANLASLANIWRFVAAADHDALGVVVASTHAQLLDKHAEIAHPAGFYSLDAQPGLAGINFGRMPGVLFVQFG